MAATLALSLGTPMWLGGDEIGRTQRGNNNAYCHDDETSWLDWRADPARSARLAFVRRAFATRRDNAVFRRRRHLDGEPAGIAVWLRPDGERMQPADWHAPDAHCVALWIDASAGEPQDERGRAQVSRRVLLLLNAGARTQRFVLPDPGHGARWRAVLDSSCDAEGRRVRAGAVRLAPCSLLLLEHEATP